MEDRELTEPRVRGADGSWLLIFIPRPLLAGKRPRSLTGAESDFRLFSHLQRIIDFDPKIADRARQLCMSSSSWTARRFFVRR
jgi:hypothetical protein